MHACTQDFCDLKGSWSKHVSWPENSTYTCTLHLGLLPSTDVWLLLVQEKYFVVVVALNLSSAVCCHFSALFATEERKKGGVWRIYISDNFAKHAGLVFVLCILVQYILFMIFLNVNILAFLFWKIF